MKKVLLFGSTGNLGKRIAAALVQQGYQVTAVARSEARAAEARQFAQQAIVADVTSRASLEGLCRNFPIVVSALGKSVSPADKSKPSFWDVDYTANSHILDEALRSGVQKFVYISAFGAEHYPHLAYFAAHHQFSEKLQSSGIDYAVIKPPALFSAFVELLPMARKGRLVVFGKGDKKTNPIAEGDLASICVAAIEQPNTVVEAGGKEVLSRRQLNELIQQAVAPEKRLITVPIGLVKATLPLLKLVSGNLYDKLAFFLEVMQHDTLAPPRGETRLADYLQQEIRRQAPEGTA